MFKVIKMFTDLQDNGYKYNVGDVFPHNGKSVSDERIKELSSYHNRQKTPLIEEIKDEPKKDTVVAEKPVKESVSDEVKEIKEETPKKRTRKKNAN